MGLIRAILFVFSLSIFIAFSNLPLAVGVIPDPCENPDRDGDGSQALICDGDDCDDGDANRFPDNPEVCDPMGHDEDCDPKTFGEEDKDHDGEFSFLCCNTEDIEGALYCGSDCDDQNPAIRSGAMICASNTEISAEVKICAFTSDRFGEWSAATCQTDTGCISQPNGLGICLPEDEGFCGDGISGNNAFFHEFCDDGNVINGDGCSALCQVEFCGDGVVQPGYEECDDGNSQGGDSCSSDCKKEETPEVEKGDDSNLGNPLVPITSGGGCSLSRANME